MDGTDFSKLSVVTQETYNQRIKKLQESFGKTMLQIIKAPKTSIKRIQKLYPEATSQKAYFTVFLAIFKYTEGLKTKYAKQFVLWEDAFNKSRGLVEDRYKENKATPKQKEGFVLWSELLQQREKLSKGSIERLLLSIYTLIPPLRADFNRVAIYKGVPENPEPNYLDLNKGELVLNEYKTEGKFGTYRKVLPNALLEEIKASLQKEPRNWLFWNANEEPFTPNAFVHFARRIFQKIFKKPLTINLIRHAFINSLDFNHLSIKEKQLLGEEMRHSLVTQDTYRLLDADK